MARHDEALDAHRELLDAPRLRDGARAEACSRNIFDLDLAARDLSSRMGGAGDTWDKVEQPRLAPCGRQLRRVVSRPLFR
ncbi:hypothetical protein [Shinella sp. BYT-45]|uniref:hypothetical protein n=1 Tax=Shinella sp. BYT-45 TaxID=3377377 RepID=UPI003980C753